MIFSTNKRDSDIKKRSHCCDKINSEKKRAMEAKMLKLRRVDVDSVVNRILSRIDLTV